MKRRIAISAGHSNVPGKDRGALINDLTEGDLTVEFRNILVKEFKKNGITVSVDPDSNVTFQTVALFRQYFGPNDICIDIHFNSASSRVSGAEVLVPKNADLFEKDLARELSLAIASTLMIPNRGVKSELESARKKLLFMTIPAKTVLLEVCFMSNADDLAKYNNYKDLLAERIVDIVDKYRNIK